MAERPESISSPWSLNLQFRANDRLCGSFLPALLAEYYAQFAAPVFAQPNQFPLDLWCKITQDRLIGRMDAQLTRREQQPRRQRRNFRAGEVAHALEGRDDASRRACFPIIIQRTNTDPVI